jgi:hypothetical protein
LKQRQSAVLWDERSEIRKQQDARGAEQAEGKKSTAAERETGCGGGEDDDMSMEAWSMERVEVVVDSVLNRGRKGLDGAGFGRAGSGLVDLLERNGPRQAQKQQRRQNKTALTE